MAQSKSFFGLRRGSTKSHTYSVFNGKQVTKDRVESVKNPRSQLQMVQRMVMNTAGAAYSAMKEIVDHSFEGKTYGLQSMMYFTSKNARLLRENMNAEESKFAYCFYKYRGLMQGAFQISEGSIPSTLVKGKVAATSSTVSTVTLGTLSGATITADALMEQLGVIAGDMATVCFMRDYDTYGEDEFAFVRFKFIAGGTEALTAGNLANYVEIESNLPINVTLGAAAEAAVFSVAVTSGIGGLGTVLEPLVATIHSRKSDTKWLRSTEFFELPSGYDSFPSWQEAIESYPIGASYVLNGGAVE